MTGVQTCALPIFGGIKLVDDDCSTGVPGLYAAGDAASRERITGAVTGGGGPNSSWAIASGNWSGAAAARFAARESVNHNSNGAKGIGRAGLRAAKATRSSMRAADAVQTVRDEILPIHRNFFRDEAGLRQSLARLDSAWCDVRDHLEASGIDAVRTREAAAMVVTSRWAYTSAIARAESRGMQRRLDQPAADPRFVCAFETTGIDHIAVTQTAIANTAQIGRAHV